MGIALTVLGLLATVGPLALDLGGTDASPSGGSTDDRPDADGDTGDSDAATGSGANGNGATGDGGPRETIGGAIPGEDANPGKCVIA